MKPIAKSLVCAALCAGIAGCGGSKTRTWRASRYTQMRPLPTMHGGSSYVPPVEPYAQPVNPIPPAPPKNIAPPVRPEDLEPMPTPAENFKAELPPPPAEAEESVQFLMPEQPSPMPNALDPVSPRPLLEQSSATRPTDRRSSEVLGDGKIALRMQGHSTFPGARLKGIETLSDSEASSGLMQVQYEPLLAPAPGR